MIRAVAVAGLVAAAGLFAAESATACSCAYVAPERLLKEADGAVVARLLRVKAVPETTRADFVYRTGRVVKGRRRLERGRRLVVRSESSGSVCGLSRGYGKPIGLFLTRDGDRWTSGACGEIPARRMRRLRPAARGGAAGLSDSLLTLRPRRAPIQDSGLEWPARRNSTATGVTARPRACS